MFFSVKELEVKKIRFETAFPPGEIDFLDASLRQVEPLKTTGEAELLSNTLGEIRVRGHLSVTMEAECDRCLEAVRLPLDTDFDLFFRPAETAPDRDEVAIDEGESELSFYEGSGLELETILREHVLLSLPMHKICEEACRGICPVCGQNRNQVDCHCETRPVDDRWAALRNLKTGTQQ